MVWYSMLCYAMHFAMKCNGMLWYAMECISTRTIVFHGMHCDGMHCHGMHCHGMHCHGMHWSPVIDMWPNTWCHQIIQAGPSDLSKCLRTL